MDEATKALAQIAKRQLDDAQAEIARLTSERDLLKNWQDHNANEVPRLKMQIEAMQEGRDQARARAASAAMDMRERAAGVCAHHLTDEADMLLADMWAEHIRALPIDPDAQKALDKMLAKAREDAIREAADIVSKNRDISGWVSHDAILALLNEGGRDE